VLNDDLTNRYKNAYSTPALGRATEQFDLVQKESGDNGPTINNDDVQIAIHKKLGPYYVDLQTPYNLFPSLYIDNNANPALLKEVQIDPDFEMLAKYPNIKIDKGSFSLEELNALKDVLNFQANDPDGKILLESINKKYPQGFSIKKDASSASKAHAAAYVEKGSMIIGGGFNPSDKAGIMHLLTHEMTHAATAPNVPAKGTNEAMANVLAARLTYRYGGNKTTEENNYGHTSKFDGSTEAEAEVYKYTLLDTYKADGAWPKAGYSYDGTPDFSYGEYLESLGFNFDFPFEIELGPR